MAFDHSLEDFVCSFLDLRKSRKHETILGKRLNTKETRDRRAAMAQRDSQRSAAQIAKDLELERQHLEALNCLVDENYLKKQHKIEARLREKADKRLEKQQLYEETMLKEAIGEPPTDLSAKKLQMYEESAEKMRKSLNARVGGPGEGWNNRKALLKTLVMLSSS